ncbi:MAG: hypothetical protein RL518_54 [Pseudomonadota bacterium]|jgi:hypothetical protein
MDVFKNVMSVFKRSGGEALMPAPAVRHPQSQFSPEELRTFIDGVRERQQGIGEGMLFASDILNIFARANINSSWTIASCNLNVFLASLESIGHSGTCMWIEGREVPEAIAVGDVVLECSPVAPHREQIELFHKGRIVGNGYAMPGWVGASPQVIGWIAMIDTDAL